MSYKYDAYGECVVNDPLTYSAIVSDLYERGHVITTWADGDGSKFDLVWSWDATRIGRSSMVDQGPGKLHVGIVGVGCFAFTTGYGYLSPNYVAEKLKCGHGPTAERLASIISAVRGGLADELARDGAHL